MLAGFQDRKKGNLKDKTLARNGKLLYPYPAAQLRTLRDLRYVVRVSILFFM